MKVKMIEKGNDKVKNFGSFKQFSKWMAHEKGSFVIKYKLSRKSKEAVSGDWLDIVNHLKENREVIFKVGGFFHAWIV